MHAAALRFMHLGLAFLAVCIAAIPAATARAQIGANASGGAGVVIDAQGVLRAQAVPDAGLSAERRKAAAAALPGDLQKSSKFRKVALSRLEAEFAKAAATGRGIPEEMQKLAGLTRVQYVFVYPGEG